MDQENGRCSKRTEDGSKRTEDGSKRTEDGSKRTEDGSKRTMVKCITLLLIELTSFMKDVTFDEDEKESKRNELWKDEESNRDHVHIRLR